MVAAPGEEFKLPEDKLLWISFKPKLFAKAASLGLLPILTGKLPIPKRPNRLQSKKFKYKIYYEQQLKEYQSKELMARSFLFNISDGTSKISLIRKFELENGEKFDVVNAFKSLIDFYETPDGAISQRLGLEEKLDSISSDNPNLKLRFNDLLCQLQEISQALANLPTSDSLEIDDKTKRIKLFNAIKKDEKLGFVLNDPNTFTDDFQSFIDRVQFLIKWKSAISTGNIFFF